MRRENDWPGIKNESLKKVHLMHQIFFIGQIGHLLWEPRLESIPRSRNGYCSNVRWHRFWRTQQRTSFRFPRESDQNDDRFRGYLLHHGGQIRSKLLGDLRSRFDGCIGLHWSTRMDGIIEQVESPGGIHVRGQVLILKTLLSQAKRT